MGHHSADKPSANRQIRSLVLGAGLVDSSTWLRPTALLVTVNTHPRHKRERSPSSPRGAVRCSCSRAESIRWSPDAPERIPRRAYQKSPAMHV